MKKLFFTLLLSAGCWSAVQARTWFASSGVNSGSIPAGSDATGTGTVGFPYATIQKAASQAQPGDIVYVRGGTYSSNTSYTPVLLLGSNLETQYSGTSAASKIVFQNYGSESVLIDASNLDNGILITGNYAYIDIIGFRIRGNNGNVNGGVPTPGSTTVVTDPAGQPGSCTYEKTQNGFGTPKYNTNGIYIQGTNTGSTYNIPNNIRLIRNEIFNCGGAGIATFGADYINIDQNLVYNNSWYTVYGASGITINASRNLNTNAGYHTQITHNKCFNNRLYVEWFSKTYPTPTAAPYGVCQGITDGNGIIIDKNDVFLANGTKDVANSYSGTFQIANNLCVNNGGAGIQVFKSSNVDVVNNTCYQNSRSKELAPTRGEVFLNGVINVLVQNNIFSTGKTPAPDNLNAKTYGLSGTNSGISFTNNLFFDAANTAANTASTGLNAIVADPLFNGAGFNLTTADFTLKTTSPRSPAINAGLNTLANGRALNYNDLAGNPRITPAADGSTGRVDLGAYESAVAGAARAALATTGPASTGSPLEAYPNPFSGAATLRYALEQAGPVRLEVLDLLGRRVALLVNETQALGRHEVQFPAPGQEAALYQVRLTTAQGTTAQKLSAQP